MTQALSRGLVCVIDDDKDIRDAMRFILEMEGFGVCEAADGAEGLVCIREARGICLVLLDLMMPKMSGWEFRKHQLQDPELASIPVVVLSGGTHTAEHANNLRANAYIVKPVDRVQLVDMARRFCGERHDARS
jgi:CheY-like chemotaxis protein